MDIFYISARLGFGALIAGFFLLSELSGSSRGVAAPSTIPAETVRTPKPIRVDGCDRQVPGQNYYRILDDARAAAQARVDLIRSARENIIASYFIIDNDISALGGLALLRYMAREYKVESYIIVDAFANGLSRAMIKHLDDEGVHIRVHHPWDWSHPIWALQRMHDKMLIVDGKMAVLGGRNIARSYFKFLKTGNFLDRDVMIGGPVIQSVVRYWERLWRSDHIKHLNLFRVTTERADAAGRELDKAMKTMEANGYFDNPPHLLGEEDKHSAGLAVSTNHIQGKHRDLRPVRTKLETLIRHAKKSILIETPYLVPTDLLLEALRAAVNRGVEVTILTSSTRSNDGVLPAGAYLRYRRQLAKAGISIYEYQGPDALHAKSAVFDDAIAVIASFNMDPRSAYLNSEIAVVSQDPARALELKASIQSHYANSRLVVNKGKMDRTYSDFKGLGFKKGALVACSYALARVLRKQI